MSQQFDPLTSPFDSLETLLKSINELPLTPPPQVQIDPRRAAQIMRPSQPPALPSPPRPEPGAHSTTYIGATRKMQFSYDTLEGAREYHRVYDFDIGYRQCGVDYVPFERIFLALQQTRTRFVAAFLLMKQRECVAVITKDPMPHAIKNRGRYYLQLNFDCSAGQYGGLPLVACYNETFTVRVVVAEKTGTNFFLILEGQQYRSPPIIQQLQQQPFAFNVVWSGSPQMSSVCVRGGNFHTPIQRHWEPQMQGVANIVKKNQMTRPGPEVEEYDPTRFNDGDVMTYDPAAIMF